MCKLEIVPYEEVRKLIENSPCSSGNGDLVKKLYNNELVKQVRKNAGIVPYDHVHLTQYEDDDFKGIGIFTWCGRASNGYHYDFGQYMRIVK